MASNPSNQYGQNNSYNYNMSAAGSKGGDVETGNANTERNDDRWGVSEAFSDKNVRIRFIRKVYLIVTSQLLFTFGVCAIFVFVDSVKKFATNTDTGLYFYLASYIIFVILIFVFSFCQCTKGLQRVPYNYILLSGITISMSYMLGMISAFHSTEAVLVAVGITLFISVGVTLFAMQTRFDFTGWLPLIACCVMLSLCGFGISCAILFRSAIMQAVYGGLGALVMALFLAIDTQLLIGSSRFRYSEEDYINAALQLYLDICLIFLYLLRMLNGNR